MIFRRKKSGPDPKKATELEAKGDRYAGRQDLRKALKAYRGACEANPDNPVIYQKLIEIKGQLQEDWSEEDFSETLNWTMRKQELENPGIKEVYEVLSPEYNEIKQTIFRLLTTPPELRDPLITKIKNYGIKAVRPLLDTLLSLDALARGDSGETSSETHPPGGH
jgi:hypothetical protein